LGTLLSEAISLQQTDRFGKKRLAMTNLKKPSLRAFSAKQSFAGEKIASAKSASR
jgi:hypothetical protein